MARKYFGTDGVRGRVGQEPITPEFVMRLGFAAGRVLAAGAEGSVRPAVLIGKDTRISGYMLEAALQAGFTAAGVDVLLTGPLPTPGIAYLTRAWRLSAGVVLSASHNPYDDNGIKFFSADGNKLPDATELRIEQALEEPMQCVPSARLGRARRLEDAAGRYIEFCKSSFPNRLDLKGLRIVVDAANGAAYHTAPPVFHELGADVIEIGSQPDGMNINDDLGAVHPDRMRRAVLADRADYGIGLDGDADRLVIVDADGRIYNGDQLLYAIVCERLLHGPVGGAVGTLMSNLALEQALAARGVPFARANVGDRYVLEMLLERGWLFGGESSGHLLALDCHSTGDGTISALQVLAAVKSLGRSLADICGELRMLPQELVNVRIERGFDWQGSEALAQARAAAEAALGDNGRVLIRASGTEPLLRIMVEATDAATARHWAAEMARTVAAPAQVEES
ncbi:MAG: phosphoglucosamine mutase [Burkholderiaceae bacterium]